MKKNDSLIPGFTLIELLITSAVIGIILTIGLASYTRINRRQIFKQSVENVLEDLRLAQSKALSGEKPTACLPPIEKPLTGYRFVFLDEQIYQIRAACEGIDESDEPICKSGSLSGDVEKISGPDFVLFKVLSQGVELEGESARSIGFEGYSGSFNEQIVITETGEIYPSAASVVTPMESTPTPTPICAHEGEICPGELECCGVCCQDHCCDGTCYFGRWCY